MPVANRQKLDTGVYSITNIHNGRMYIGSATISFKNRWWDHKTHLRNNSHYNRYLQAAWNKYGEDWFLFSILYVCPPNKCLENEQRMIEQYKTMAHENGYNLCPVAGSVLGYAHTDDTKRRISAANKGKILSEEVKKKISEASKKQWAETNMREVVSRKLTGRVVSKETRNKISVSHIGKRHTVEHKDRIRNSMKAATSSTEKRAIMVDAAKKAYRKKHGVTGEVQYFIDNGFTQPIRRMKHKGVSISDIARMYCTQRHIIRKITA